MNISYQAWKSFRECPKKYYLKHRKKQVSEVPVNDYHRLYGILVQQFFQMFCNIWRFKTPYMPIEETRYKMAILFKNLLEVSTVAWPRPGAGPGPDELLEQACLDTHAVMDGQTQNYFLNTQSEVDISAMVMDGVNINCRVDFIHKDAMFDSNIMIFDGKGTDKIGKNIDKNQLYFYTLLYKMHTGIMPMEIGIFYYRFNTFIPIDLNDDILNKFRNQLSKDITSMVSLDCTQATPGNKSCRYCEYRPSCMESREYFAKKAKPSTLSHLPDTGSVNLFGF